MDRMGIVLFTYNRPVHTQKVLDSLVNGGVDELFIFQDGPKENENSSNWNEVRKIIEEEDRIKTIHKILADRNKGLAQSIEDGIEYVLAQKEEIIVIEDDCCIRNDFIRFMQACFQKYRNNKEVKSISGSSWPIKLPEGYEYDIYFTGRINSCGWGTWKDRWEEYQKDYTVLHKIKSNKDKQENLRNFGPDLENMLMHQIQGRIDSWAIFWALHVINCQGKCVVPVENMISNIGFDGTGVHSGKNENMTLPFGGRIYKDINFPNQEIFIPEIVREMRSYFYRTTQAERDKYYRGVITKWLHKSMKGKRLGGLLKELDCKSVAIWGLGEISELLLREIKGNDFDIYFVDSRRRVDEFEGYMVVSPEEVMKADILIIIPGYDLENISERIHGEKFSRIFTLDALLDIIS